LVAAFLSHPIGYSPGYGTTTRVVKDNSFHLEKLPEIVWKEAGQRHIMGASVWIGKITGRSPEGEK
jgi:hypothetical protein